MKWIIYSLLLLNIGVAVWHFRMPLLNKPVSDSQWSASATPQLILLSESEQPAHTLSGASQRCFSLGPFSSEAKSRAAAKQLAKQGIDVEQQKSSERVREGFWVLLAPAENREKARETIKALKEKGEKEFFLVVTGEQLNGISLGVFSKIESAQRRLAQVKKIGFSPIVQTVHLPNTDYWLEWPRANEQQISDKLILQLKKQNQEIGIVEKRCKTN